MVKIFKILIGVGARLTLVLRGDTEHLGAGEGGGQGGGIRLAQTRWNPSSLFSVEISSESPGRLTTGEVWLTIYLSIYLNFRHTDVTH